MVYCSVVGCNNCNNKPLQNSANISFFTFPHNEEFVKKWLDVCKPSKTSVKSKRICSVHFKESCYKPKPAYLLNCIGYSPKKGRKLLPDAVPTENLYSQENRISTNSLNCNDTSNVMEGTRNHSQTPLSKVTNFNLDILNMSNRDNSLNLQRKPQITNNEAPASTYFIPFIPVASPENSSSKNDETNKEFQRLHKEVKKLRKEVKRLKNPKTSVITKEVRKVLMNIFTQKQTQKLLNPDKGVKWTYEDIADAMSLRAISPKAYQWLRKSTKYPLPGLSTLRRWAGKISLNGGILDEVVKMMGKVGVSMQIHQKLVVLSFDEMYISHKMEIDKKNQQVVGPHKTVQVGMARGLFKNWKQVIYFDFDKPLTPEIINDIISQLYDEGFIVVGLINDLGPSNQKIYTDFNIGIKDGEKCYFQHLRNENYKVFIFPDAPHLLKLIRNHLLDDGFTINGKFITKQCFEDIVSMNATAEVTAFHNITQELLDVTGSARQNVSKAAKLLSKTSARAIKCLGEEGLLSEENWKETYEFIELVDSWFNLFNSKVTRGCGPGLEPYGYKLEEQNRILDKMESTLKSMIVGTSKTKLPFQKGILLGCKSLRDLFTYLKETFRTEDFEIKYILTNRLCQDIVDNLLSYIRNMGATNDQPSALNVRYRFRWYILGKHSAHMLSEDCNTEADNAVTLINLADKAVSTEEDRNDFSNDDFEDSVDDEDVLSDDAMETSDYGSSFSFRTDFWFEENDFNDEIASYSQVCDGSAESSEDNDSTGDMQDIIKDIVKGEGLKYIAGYVAHRFRHKYPYLGDFTNKLPLTTDAEGLDWIRCLSDGYLTYPCDDLIQITSIMNSEFENFHGLFLSKSSGIFNSVIHLVKQKITSKVFRVHVSDEVIACLVCTRTYIRLKELNKLLTSDPKNKIIKKKIFKFMK